MTNYDGGTTLSVKKAIKLLISMEEAAGEIFTQNEKIALSMAISALEKEKEPAPQEAETSSSKNNSIDNDNTKLKICQEVIEEQLESLIKYFSHKLSDEEQRAFNEGQRYRELLFVKKTLEEVTQCQ